MLEQTEWWANTHCRDFPPGAGSDELDGDAVADDGGGALSSARGDDAFGIEKTVKLGAASVPSHE